MSGYDSKRQMAADKLQDESDMLTIAYLYGYEKGKKAALAQPAQEPAFKWHSVFQEMPAENSHILFCFGVHIVEGSFTKNGWASLAYGTAQPDFWAYFPPPPHHKRNQELYAMPPKRPWVGLTDEERNDCLVQADPCECLADPEAHQLMIEVEAKLRERNS